MIKNFIIGAIIFNILFLTIFPVYSQTNNSEQLFLTRLNFELRNRSNLINPILNKEDKLMLGNKYCITLDNNSISEVIHEVPTTINKVITEDINEYHHLSMILAINFICNRHITKLKKYFNYDKTMN